MPASDSALVDYGQVDCLLEAAGRDGVNEILRAFWKSTDDLVRQLNQQIAGANFAEAARTSHAIKGSAANVGANMLADAARGVEVCCKGGDGAGAASALIVLIAAYEKTRSALTAHVEAAA